MKDYRKLYQNKLVDDLVGYCFADYIYTCETKEEAEETVKQIYEAIFALPDTPRLFENSLKEILENCIF